jgi:VIT1/CCC1 family predicted Fe2+/Mn2+ transporter
MRAFVRRYLDPADRLGEILFGLIMALGFTGAVRLGRDEADNHALLIGIFGCNLAWAIVDGVMFVLTALFERGRQARATRDVLAASTEEAALQRIDDELGDPLLALTKREERQEVLRSVLERLRRGETPQLKLQREDFLGGLAVALIILVATLPVVAPFLLVTNPSIAVRVSNWVALTELFLLGAWWGSMVGLGSLRIATGLTLVGVVLVLVTILLGG